MADSIPVPPRVRELAVALAQPQPIRRGSISERFVKCSKPGCPCATDPEARHGPYYSLTHAVAGKTHSRFLTATQAAIARRQIQDGRRFRQQADDFWKACEEWADAELQQDSEAFSEAKKGGSKQPSKRRSRRKWPPS